MKTRPKFTTEVELCAAFIAWVGRERPEVKCYAEWAGWDILLAYPEGWQIGIQAKLRLNAEVVLQAAPDQYYGRDFGPDFRAILVPDRNGWAQVASRLGLIAFSAHHGRYDKDGWDFAPDLRPYGSRQWPTVDAEWLDWNPAARHALPPTATDSVAGSSAPVTLTPWKLRALAVLAELSAKGTITTKRMRALGVNPSRWTQYLWLMPGEKRGDWVRGEKCPRFDEQHPSAYTLALENARRVQS